MTFSTFLILAASLLAGEESADVDTAAQPLQPAAYSQQVTVLGTAEEAAELPGSAHQISNAELEQQDHSDIHRVLRTIPGINVQDEEGFGLRPNIGMRGTGVERSSKITLLEDGVLIAPAPYSAPAAYYFPTIGRMEMVEVRKGSSSITQGPYTTGGVLNLVSTSIPSQFSGKVNVAGGDDATLRLHANVGDARSRFGWLIETYQLHTDGFKKLDGVGETGFEFQDYLGKFRVNSASTARFQQVLELKVGYTTQNGDETYVGLTDEDFRRDPLRRYAGSREDVIDTEHEQAQLRHFIQLSPRMELATTLYRNDFSRNWYKLDSINGIAVAAILENPRAFAGLLDILRGEADDLSGALRLRNNRRSYYSSGLQSTLNVRLARHDLELGARLHQDEEDRFQEDDRWGIVDGQMKLISRGSPGSNANRIGQADAISFFAQDRIALGRWTVTPGFRVESIDLLQRDYGRNDPDRTGAELTRRENELDVFIPGVGVHYRVTPTLGVFAGVHKGFAPASPGTSEETDPEESVSYELGMRRSSGVSNVTLIGFFNDYSNLLGRDTASSGGTGSGDLFNGGEVKVAGLEFSVAHDLGKGRFGVPVRLAYTFTDAAFQSSFETTFEDWAPRVQKGDELPYLPKHQIGGSMGLTGLRWSTFLNLSYADAMRTSAGHGPIDDSESTDEFLTFDLALNYQLPHGVKAFAQIRNLSDETYIVARRPAGIRPGLPRSVLFGVEWSF